MITADSRHVFSAHSKPRIMIQCKTRVPVQRGSGGEIGYWSCGYLARPAVKVDGQLKDLDLLLVLQSCGELNSLPQPLSTDPPSDPPTLSRRRLPISPVHWIVVVSLQIICCCAERKRETSSCALRCSLIAVYVPLLVSESSERLKRWWASWWNYHKTSEKCSINQAEISI